MGRYLSLHTIPTTALRRGGGGGQRQQQGAGEREREEGEKEREGERGRAFAHNLSKMSLSRFQLNSTKII